MSAPAGGIRRGSVRAGGATFHFVEAGEGPLVVLLHGFPDAPHGWRFQLPALAAAGRRAVAPFLRGYGPAERPRAVRAYRVSALADDVAALVGALGAGRAAAVVGHDWGGAIGWHLAAHRPELLERLAVLNAPHPAALLHAIPRSDQALRSAYMLFFQLPWLPERVLAAHDFAAVRRAVAREVRRSASFTEEDWREQRAALAEPGALRAAINYYRAAARATLLHGRREVAPSPIRVPAMLLWGERDRFLRPTLADASRRWAPQLVVRRFSRAGHWVHWDEPEAVNAELVRWLGARW